MLPSRRSLEGRGILQDVLDTWSPVENADLAAVNTPLAFIFPGCMWQLKEQMNKNPGD